LSLAPSCCAFIASWLPWSELLFSPIPFLHDGCLAMGLKINGASQPWTKINLSSFKLFLSDICHSNEHLITTARIRLF
jgi:hypothetical protein